MVAVGWDRRINIYYDTHSDSNIHHVQHPVPYWQDDLVSCHTLSSLYSSCTVSRRYSSQPDPGFAGIFPKLEGVQDSVFDISKNSDHCNLQCLRYGHLAANMGVFHAFFTSYISKELFLDIFKETYFYGFISSLFEILIKSMFVLIFNHLEIIIFTCDKNTI